MNALASLFSLPHSVAITVPSTNDVDEQISVLHHDAEVMEIIGQLSRLFGGATATPGEGGWISPSAGLVTEKVTIVESSCTEEDFQASLSKAVKVAEALKARMRQDAVALRVDGKLFLV